jgi:hypothetical protein
MTYIDVFMQIPLKSALKSYIDTGWIPESWVIPIPVWLNNVGMAKKPWGWDRVTTIGPAWLRWIIRFLGIGARFSESAPEVVEEGCRYPAIQIVDGNGQRTEYYSDYLRYVNNDTDCDVATFHCPQNKGNGSQLVGRLDV